MFHWEPEEHYCHRLLYSDSTLLVLNTTSLIYNNQGCESVCEKKSEIISNARKDVIFKSENGVLWRAKQSEIRLKSEPSHPWIMPFWLSTDDLHYLTRHWPFRELLQWGHHLIEMQLIDEAGCCRDDADGLLGQEELHHPLVAWGAPGG